MSSPHPSGIYINQSIPIDKETGDRAAIPYKEAEELGYIKVDILSNSYYSWFSSKDELLSFIDKPMDWSILLDEKIIRHLPHIAKHKKLVDKIRPESIEELADLLALIRPGKARLVEKYINSPENVRKELYNPDDAYYFKKSHAIALAILITVVAKKISMNFDTVEW